MSFDDRCIMLETSQKIIPLDYLCLRAKMPFEQLADDVSGLTETNWRHFVSVSPADEDGPPAARQITANSNRPDAQWSRQTTS